MAIAIGVPPSASSTQTVTLNKRSFSLRFDYNSSYDYWSFSLYTPSGETIIEGEKIVPFKEYLSRYVKDNVIGGLLFTQSLDDVEVTRDNFGIDKTHTLTFIAEEDYT